MFPCDWTAAVGHFQSLAAGSFRVNQAAWPGRLPIVIYGQVRLPDHPVGRALTCWTGHPASVRASCFRVAIDPVD